MTKVDDTTQALDILQGVFASLYLAYHDGSWATYLGRSLQDERGKQRLERFEAALLFLTEHPVHSDRSLATKGTAQALVDAIRSAACDQAEKLAEDYPDRDLETIANRVVALLTPDELDVLLLLAKGYPTLATREPPTIPSGPLTAKKLLEERVASDIYDTACTAVQRIRDR